MPFTPTHVAAILPIAAAAPRAFPFSALVIGSMIPDLPLFVPLPVTYATTHSIPGLFLACLPLGMACLLTFQCLMKRPLFALLPDVIRSRCASLSASSLEPSVKFLASASLAIIVGAATHVFWDSFTHRRRWGTTIFPRLNDTVLTVAGYDVPGYKALQYGCTLILLPLVVLLLVFWIARQAPGPLKGLPTLPKPWITSVRLILPVLPIFVALLVWVCDDSTPYVKVGYAITVSGLVFGISLLAYSVFYHAALGHEGAGNE